MKQIAALFAVLTVLLISGQCFAYEGIYRGEFGGPTDNGTWVLQVDEVWDCYLTTWSNVYENIWYTSSYVQYDGTIYRAESNGDYIFAVIRPDGTVEGEYGNIYTGRIDALGQGEKCSPEGLASHAGTYTGTFSGDDSGSWRMTCYADGWSEFAGKSDVYGTFGSAVAIVTCDGEMFGVVMETNTVFHGQMNSSDISGQWYNLDTGETGTFKSDSSGGGGGGGCFIKAAGY